jgi:hypothetical protein
MADDFEKNRYQQGQTPGQQSGQPGQQPGQSGQHGQQSGQSGQQKPQDPTRKNPSQDPDVEEDNQQGQRRAS